MLVRSLRSNACCLARGISARSSSSKKETAVSLQIQAITPDLKAGKYNDKPLPVHSISYKEHGHPTKVLKFEEEQSQIHKALKDDEVLVRMLLAPVNPSDFNQIQGIFDSKKSLPAVGGNEGLGVVLAVGPKVQGIKVNDWVLPAKHGFGTWRTFAKCTEADLMALPASLQQANMDFLAVISTAPSAALIMLEEFGGHLKPGDYIIQNGANSMVGQTVAQLARAMGCHTINVLRENGPKSEMGIDLLKSLGQKGTICVTDQYFASPEYRRLVSDIPQPKLALDCVGGRLGTELVRQLAPNGRHIVYGGQARKPLTIPVSHLVYKNIAVHGFSLPAWISQHTKEERLAQIVRLASLVPSEKIEFQIERRIFSEFAGNLAAYQNPLRFKKIVMDLMA